MIEIHFQLSVLEEDLKQVHRVFKEAQIDFPIFFIDLEGAIKIEFTSDYEEYELVKEIEKLFEGYEFKKMLPLGETEIKLVLHRYHSPFSTDGWGGPIENPINEILYLIKQPTAKEKKQDFKPTVAVSYKGEVKEYHINLIHGKKGEEKGFLVLKDFENYLYGEKHEVGFYDGFRSKLSESFRYGLSHLEQYVEMKVKAYKKSRKKNKKWFD